MPLCCPGAPCARTSAWAWNSKAWQPQRRAENVAALLDLVGSTDVADAYPRELSGGMKMRVSIARALATNPAPAADGRAFRGARRNVARPPERRVLRLRDEQNWTAVFVTHSVAEAVFLSTRIMVLAPNPGRIHAFSGRLACRRAPRRCATSPEFDAHGRAGVARAAGDAGAMKQRLITAR